MVGTTPRDRESLWRALEQRAWLGVGCAEQGPRGLCRIWY